MAGCLRRYVANGGINYDDAAAIVAELPEPVDSDLIEARELAANRGDDMDARILAGEMDAFDSVLHRLEGIKRGRSLASQDASA